MINAVVPDYYSEEAIVAACFLEIFREEVLIWDNKAFGEAVFAIKDHNSEQDLVDLKLELVTIALPIPNKCLDGGKKYYIDDDNPPCFPDGSRYRAANLIIDEYAGNYFQDIMAAQKDEMHDIDKYAAIGVSKLHDLAQSNIFPPALWQTIRSSYPVQEAYSLVLPFVQAFVGITAAKVRQASMIDTLRFTRPVAVFSRSRTCSPWLPPAVKFLIEPPESADECYIVQALDSGNYPIIAEAGAKGCVDYDAKNNCALFTSREEAMDCAKDSVEAPNDKCH